MNDIKPDLDTPEHIAQFVKAFYQSMLTDSLLSPIFIDVAAINLEQHTQLICHYWEKLLLGGNAYHRHTMNIHRNIYQQMAFDEKVFRRWHQLFSQTLDANFAGQYANRARSIAQRILLNMYRALTNNNKPLQLTECFSQ